MNKVLITVLASSALALSTASIAATTRVAAANMNTNNAAGVYISGNLGYGDVDVKLPSVPGASLSKRGFAWSTAVGYQFNQYIAVEGGYIQFADLKARATANSDSLTITTDAVDLAVKGIYPINDQFSVFGKAGAAYLSHKGVLTANSMTITVRDSEHRIVPLLGVGASYSITQNWAVDVQGITTIKSGDNFPATYTGLAGVTYKFS